MALAELKAVYEKKDDIPADFVEWFTEKTVTGGKKQWELTGIQGLKTQGDVDRVTEALTKERNDHKTAKTELATLKTSFGAWAALQPDEIAAKIDGYDALELAAKSAGNANPEEINKRVQAELSRHTAPLERKIRDLETNLGTANEKVTTFEQRERQRTIHDAVRKARQQAKVIDSAEEDALILAERMFEVDESGRVTTKDGVGVTPGVEPDVWFTEMQTKRPHWWPESHGGGARGGRGDNGAVKNPWGKGAAWNVTEQMAIVRQFGEEKAAQMAAMAGSKLGATHPPA